MEYHDLDTSEARRLIQADGYRELDLPKEAWKTLSGSSVEVKESFEWLVLAAEVQMQMKDYAATLPLLDKAILRYPEKVVLYTHAGWCFKRLQRLPEAIESLLMADRICRQLKDETTHSLVMYNLACYYSLSGDKEETLSWLAAALEKDPGYVRSIADEADFDTIRQDEDFQSLVARFAVNDSE